MKILLLLIPVFAFFLNIFGLMRLIPPYITVPLLFFTIYFTVYFFHHKKQFKGFQKATIR
ncbi:hypothetical protein MUN88_12625 [Gracilibacillus caseinilyticus]|uniref:Uncharacterized protein n=1 Tax=Gracilibacillus caseinilyticus TaxID=2932256 RepID=A0ABY4ERG6_9BACI|nr:hypothetical protein [Gracilibacillus caseinilyticus]UOQ46935.1 hypothetical protein MUN88_12625 [Gracilibacillus caseinilyticus]